MDIEKGLPETVRASWDNNDETARGAFVIYCIGKIIEVKARGLTPSQLQKIIKQLQKKCFNKVSE